MYRHRLTLLLALTTALSACSPAPPKSSAEIESTGLLANQGRQASAQRKLQSWAEDGNPVAQRELALTLARLPENYPAARSWFEKAARAGDGEAAYQLGDAYRTGALGLKADNSKAWLWLRQAAEHQHAIAALSLGRMARNGDGVPKDLTLAARWLQTAAELKNPQAMFLLSNAYMTGEGVPRNPLMARRLLEMAADRHYPAAIQALAMAIQGGDLMMVKDDRRVSQLLMEAGHESRLRWGE